MKKFLLYSVSLFLLIACNRTTDDVWDEFAYEKNESLQDKWDEYMKQEFEMTKDLTTKTIPVERLKIAENAIRNMMLNPTSRTNAITWQERGPNNVGGRIRAVVIDRRDATGNTVFVGSVSGGIWKTTNFKSPACTWAVVKDDLPNMAISAMAQDPSNGNILYAGTGEGWGNSDAYRGGGVYKSTDGGNTWTLLSSTVRNTSGTSVANTDFDFVQDIEVAANGHVYASCRSAAYCNEGGIMRSTDGGTSWQRVVGTFPQGSTSCNDALNFRGADIEIAPNGDVYVTTGFGSSNSNLQGKILKSPATNGANTGAAGTWNDITPSGAWRRIEIAIAPNNANIVYAVLQNGTSDAVGSIQRSNNGGSSWTNLGIPSWCDQGSSSNDFTRGQAWFNLIVNIDPTDNQKILFAGIDMFRSVNGGSSATQVTQWAAGCSSISNVHADHHNILFFPNSATEVLVATDGGMYYSSDGGTTWSSRNNNLNITQFYACAIHPTNTNYFLAGAQDNGTQRFLVAGVNATTRVVDGDGGYCHIDQTNGNIQIGSRFFQSGRLTRDAWINSISISNTDGRTLGRFINPSDYDDASSSGQLYLGDQNDTITVLTGIKGTGTPLRTRFPIPLGAKQISAITVDPNVTIGGTAWVAGSGSTTPVLLKLVGLNGTVAPVVDKNISMTMLPAGAYISSIDVKRGNSNHILVTISNFGVSNSVLESTDGGANWTNIEGNLPDMPIRWGIYAPSNALLGSGTQTGGIILGTELGIMITSQSNGGSTVWTPQNTGISNTRVSMLQFRPSDNLVAAATHGRGLFTATLQTTTAVNPSANSKGFIQYVSANPNALIIKTGNISSVKNMYIYLYDMSGRLVSSSKTNYTSQQINISQFASGAYIVRIESDKKERFVQQFIK